MKTIKSVKIGSILQYMQVSDGVTTKTRFNIKVGRVLQVNTYKEEVKQVQSSIKSISTYAQENTMGTVIVLGLMIVVVLVTSLVVFTRQLIDVFNRRINMDSVIGWILYVPYIVSVIFLMSKFVFNNLDN